MKPNESAPIVCGTDFSDSAASSHKPLLLVHVADEFNARGYDQKELTAFVCPVAKQLRTEAYRCGPRAAGFPLVAPHPPQPPA